MHSTIDILERPVYGMSEVDSSLKLSPGTARRWIDGYERRGTVYPPVVRMERTGNDIATWGEYVEARLLSEYRDAGVAIVRLRPTVERLREEFNVKYPLAFSRTWLEPHGQELVYRAQEQTGLTPELRMVVYRNDQLVLTMPADRFVKSSDFDDGEVVMRFRPDLRIPTVVIDPNRQSGQPVVRSVPTDMIAELYRAGDSPEMIASIYMLDEDLVHDALRFELDRRPVQLTAA